MCRFGWRIRQRVRCSVDESQRGAEFVRDIGEKVNVMHVHFFLHTLFLSGGFRFLQALVALVPENKQESKSKQGQGKCGPMIPWTRYHNFEQIFRALGTGLQISGLYPYIVDTIP